MAEMSILTPETERAVKLEVLLGPEMLPMLSTLRRRKQKVLQTAAVPSSTSE